MFMKTIRLRMSKKPVSKLNTSSNNIMKEMLSVFCNMGCYLKYYTHQSLNQIKNTRIRYQLYNSVFVSFNIFKEVTCTLLLLINIITRNVIGLDVMTQV